MKKQQAKQAMYASASNNYLIEKQRLLSFLKIGAIAQVMNGVLTKIKYNTESTCNSNIYLTK
jgi:hypothetical protein